MFLAAIRAWLQERRRRRLEREAAELADLIGRAYFCRRMSRFIDSVLSYRERRGYIAEKQRLALGGWQWSALSAGCSGCPRGVHDQRREGLGAARQRAFCEGCASA